MDEVSRSHHRQPVDTRAALRLPGPEGVDGGQRLVQPAAEHRRDRSRGTPTIRGRRSVSSDVRGPGMGGRSDGDSPQHPAPKEATQGDRHQNRQGISNCIPRVGDSDRVSVEAPDVGTRAKIFPHESAEPGGGHGRTGGPRRSGNRRGGYMGPVEVSADQRGSRKSRRGGGPPKLGSMEEPPRSPADLQDDPDTHGTRRVRQVEDPVEDRTRDDRYLLLLRGGQGHDVAHARVLSGVKTAPLHPASRYKREIGPFGDRESDAEWVAGRRGCPLLLRTSYAHKGADREADKEKFSPL